MKIFHRLRPGDVAAVIIAAALVVGAGYYARGGTDPEEVYLRNERDEWVYPVSVERSVSVPGPLGNTIVEIDDAGVRITSSPCTDKICVLMGTLTRAGDWSACLPNKVFVQIRGTESRDIDALSY